MLQDAAVVQAGFGAAVCIVLVGLLGLVDVAQDAVLSISAIKADFDMYCSINLFFIWIIFFCNFNSKIFFNKSTIVKMVGI